MSVKLQNALEALYGLERRRDKHDLDGTVALMRALGDPHRRFRSVHVAGTNGKGSVCALVERVLREAGIRTGLFTSPHLVDFRERIRVGGRWADEAWLARKLDHIASLPEGKDRTFFEVCTALAFEYFAEQGVDIAVVEVGLGGRLDCTNVITPMVSVITTIGFDHTEILGDTIEKIAFEKAGIIKPRVPVVTGVRAGAAGRMIDSVAAERGAPVVRDLRGETIDMADFLTKTGGAPGAGRVVPLVRRDTPWGEQVEMPIARTHRLLRANEGVAVATVGELAKQGVAIPWAAVQRGIAQTRWPGRLERCPGVPRLWWDGAHNVQGMMKLPGHMGRDGKPGAIVLALSLDKDLTGIAEVLPWRFADAVIVGARCRHERSLSPSAIVEAVRARGFTAVEAGDIPTAICQALDLAGERPVLLTGSLFAVGEAMEAFGGAPGEML